MVFEEKRWVGRPKSKKKGKKHDSDDEEEVQTKPKKGAGANTVPPVKMLTDIIPNLQKLVRFMFC